MGNLCSGGAATIDKQLPVNLTLMTQKGAGEKDLIFKQIEDQFDKNPTSDIIAVTFKKAQVSTMLKRSEKTTDEGEGNLIQQIVKKIFTHSTKQFTVVGIQNEPNDPSELVRLTFMNTSTVFRYEVATLDSPSSIINTLCIKPIKISIDNHETTKEQIE